MNDHLVREIIGGVGAVLIIASVACLNWAAAGIVAGTLLLVGAVIGMILARNRRRRG